MIEHAEPRTSPKPDRTKSVGATVLPELLASLRSGTLLARGLARGRLLTYERLRDAT